MKTFREILTSENVGYVLVAFGLYWAWVAASFVMTIAVLWYIISSFFKMNIFIFKLDKVFFSGKAIITNRVRRVLKGTSLSRSTSVSLAGKSTKKVLQEAGVKSRKKRVVSPSSDGNNKVTSSADNFHDASSGT